MKRVRRATVALIADDPGSPDGHGGPDAWRCAKQLSQWARAVIVHAAAGEPEHYAEAVRTALRVGQVAMIETTSVHAAAWVQRMNCKRTLVIYPTGGVHPVVQRTEILVRAS